MPDAPTIDLVDPVATDGFDVSAVKKCHERGSVALTWPLKMRTRNV
jgi:hypothetical protein